MLTAAFGEKLKSIYARWAAYIDAAARFLAALFFFFSVYRATGFWGMITPPVLIVAAVITACAGTVTVCVTGCALIIAEAFFLSPFAGAFAACELLLLYILFLRLVPEDLAAFLLMAPAFSVGAPAVVPTVCGLRRGCASAFAAASGTAVYYLLKAFDQAVPEIQEAGKNDYAAVLRALSEHALGQEAFAACLITAAAVCGVYILRRCRFRYSFEIAAAAGGAIWFLLFAAAGRMFGVAFDLPRTAVGGAVSSVAGLLIQLLFLRIDYSRTRSLRFEDDDYYYYVKAVPKMTAFSGNLPQAEFPVFDEINEEGGKGGLGSGGNAEGAGTGHTPVHPEINQAELEKRLEDSLRNL